MRPASRIAVLGWGSLIWCPRNLRIRTRWRSNGPNLPIEFARLSSDQRLTLVIHEGSKDQRTYWALADFSTLDEVRKNLKNREGARDIEKLHYVCRSGEVATGANLLTLQRVKSWLAGHRGLDAAVWTGLDSNWKTKKGNTFTAAEGVTYLLGLRDEPLVRAKEYVTHAPEQIDTEVRKDMRRRGWADITLSPHLFEPKSKA